MEPSTRRGFFSVLAAAVIAPRVVPAPLSVNERIQRITRQLDCARQMSQALTQPTYTVAGGHVEILIDSNKLTTAALSYLPITLQELRPGCEIEVGIT